MKPWVKTLTDSTFHLTRYHRQKGKAILLYWKLKFATFTILLKRRLHFSFLFTLAECYVSLLGLSLILIRVETCSDFSFFYDFFSQYCVAWHLLLISLTTSWSAVDGAWKRAFPSSRVWAGVIESVFTPWSGDWVGREYFISAPSAFPFLTLSMGIICSLTYSFP